METTQVPLSKIDYRWTQPPALSENVVSIFTDFESRLPINEPPTARGYAQQVWPSVKAIYDDIEENGLVNPLICWRVPNTDRMISLVGNQRLCSLRALKQEFVPVWIVEEWYHSNDLLKLYK